MNLTLLGSGGVSPIPRPTCFCKICTEARTKGIPYARTGPSLFVHDINCLFDTPEEICSQLNREKIKKIKSLIITHWHPDHTQGIRILEQINWNFEKKRPFYQAINVFISPEQKAMFKKFSCGSFLDYYEKKGMINIIPLKDGKKIIKASATITPYLIKHTRGFYFLIEGSGKKIIYAPCEYHHFEPSPDVKNVDVFIVHNLFWENKAVSPRKNKPEDEDSFEDMLKHAQTFGAKKIILTHIEESFKLSHDRLNYQLKKYYPAYNVTAGYDGLKIFTTH